MIAPADMDFTAAFESARFCSNVGIASGLPHWPRALAEAAFTAQLLSLVADNSSRRRDSASLKPITARACQIAAASVAHIPERFGSGERDFARRVVHSRFERWDGFSGFHLTQLSGIPQGSFYHLDCFRFQSIMFYTLKWTPCSNTPFPISLQ